MGIMDLAPERSIRCDEVTFLMLRQDDESCIIGRYLMAKAESQSLWQQVDSLAHLERERDSTRSLLRLQQEARWLRLESSQEPADPPE